MSLEQFKTQILLLHSEQSTLESLSTGFNDLYTVHCATSGSEALNTLGDIAIDVIVTAHELPGMSGLDALREAKKRSPDTIGILLAGNDGEGVEALVGAHEVFQIIRGGVTPESLRGVIDSATRQNRLMALAESANDTTAAMDEPSEHIVMETSENGSMIISDGTGQMPALNPEKVSREANLGSRAVDVLVFTKDEEFLTTVRESARGMHNIIYANTLAQADTAVREQKVGVAIVDAAMVVANVEKLTTHLRSASPRLVAIVAGRRDDGEMLMDLINRGKVYRFLLKPVSSGRARLAIEASVKHHLEAPDAAFRTAGSSTAPQAAPQPAKAAPKPVPKPKPKPKAAARTDTPKEKPAAPKAAPDQSQSVPTIRVEPRPVPVDSSSMMDDALSEAFGVDDERFTQTSSGTSRKNTASAEPEASGPGQLRLDSSGSDGSIFSDPRILGIGTAAVVVLLGLGWWMFSGSDEAAPIQEPLSGAPQITAADPAFETPAAAAPEVAVDDLIEEARLAAEAGQIFNPPGSNAVELYLAAAEAAPGNVTVASELSAIIDRALGMAESSLLERRPEDASAALQRVALADPRNARLPFLNAQLTQMQLRDYLDSARLGIREGRFEDAAAAISRARALGAENSAEVNIVADELSTALSEQRVDDVLAKANARLEEGKLALQAPTEIDTERSAAEPLAADQADAKLTPEPVLSTSVINNAPVAASTLQRSKYVAPKYPRAAQRRNLSGWVDVVFTVDIDGTVKDVSVSDSDPGITFVNAAVSAVEDWEFAPVIENEAATEKRAAVRMMFAIE